MAHKTETHVGTKRLLPLDGTTAADIECCTDRHKLKSIHDYMNPASSHPRWELCSGVNRWPFDPGSRHCAGFGDSDEFDM